MTWEVKKKHSLSTIPAVSPQEMLWETQSETWDSEAKQHQFTVLAQMQYPKPEHQEQRGLTLYTLASRLQGQ
jgi:hypothetical protein